MSPSIALHPVFFETGSLSELEFIFPVRLIDQAAPGIPPLLFLKAESMWEPETETQVLMRAKELLS